MAFQMSTALRNIVLGKKAQVSGTTIACVNGTSKITDSGNTLLQQGFRPGDVIVISGSGAGNDGYYLVSTVSTTGSEMVLATAPADESANASLTVTGMSKSWAEALKHGCLGIFSGAQPANADAIENGTLLALLTVGSGTLTVGTATNGLDFGAPTAGVMDKAAGETWSGVGLVAGTAGWGRYYDNYYLTGADTNYYSPRFDGGCGLSGVVFQMTSLVVAVGATITCDQCQITQPAS